MNAMNMGLKVLDLRIHNARLFAFQPRARELVSVISKSQVRLHVIPHSSDACEALPAENARMGNVLSLAICL